MGGGGRGASHKVKRRMSLVAPLQLKSSLRAKHLSYQVVVLVPCHSSDDLCKEVKEGSQQQPSSSQTPDGILDW